MIYGYDVSDANRVVPPLMNKSFVLIKATEGHTYTNPAQAAQASQGRRSRVHVGFYHFLWPGNIQEQAQWFVDRAASIPGDSLWCDWEPTQGGLATCAEKDQFIRAVKQLRLGHRVGLYCDRSRWLDVDKTGYAGDGLWIADPSRPAGHPGIKANWLLHQYGSPGGVDGDVASFASTASMLSWAQFGKSTTPPPLPKPPAPPAHPLYTVRDGDTLTSIAAAHGTSVAALVALNHIPDPDLIMPGQVLKLR